VDVDEYLLNGKSLDHTSRLLYAPGSCFRKTDKLLLVCTEEFLAYIGDREGEIVDKAMDIEDRAMLVVNKETRVLHRVVAVAVDIGDKEMSIGKVVACSTNHPFV